jgi:hypothetical protein
LKRAAIASLLTLATVITTIITFWQTGRLSAKRITNIPSSVTVEYFYSAAPTLVEGKLGFGTSCPNGHTAAVNQLILFDGKDCDGNSVRFTIDLLEYLGDFKSVDLSYIPLSDGTYYNFKNQVSSYI